MIFPLTLAFLLTGAPEKLDELDRSRLPADVDMVLHLDLEGLRRTQLWRTLETAEGFNLAGEIEELDEFRRRFGIDLLNDVRAVTVYKTKGEEEPSVALVRVAPSVEEALRTFQGEEGYRSVERGGVQFHVWSDGDGGDEAVYAYLHPLRGGDRLAVVAKDVKSAVRATLVVRGEEASLAGARDSALRVQPAPGSFLYLSAMELPGIEDSPASHVFGLAQGIQLDLGEAGGFLRAQAAIVTETPEESREVADLLNGLIALGNLASRELGEAGTTLRDLSRALRVSAVDNQVTVDFEYSVNALFQAARSIQDMGEQHEHDWKKDLEEELEKEDR